jgi:hypothetical protein
MGCGALVNSEHFRAGRYVSSVDATLAEFDIRQPARR